MLCASLALAAGGRAARADVEDERVLPPGGRSFALLAGLEAPCFAGACARVGAELWLAGHYRLALGLPLRASLAVGDEAKAVERVAVGSAWIELGWRRAIGRGKASWVAVELGASAPTGSDRADQLDVRRFAVSPARFGADTATAWFDLALGYGQGGEFAAARLGVLQELEEVPVTSDGQKELPTRLRVGLGGGMQLTPAWLFEAGALATAAIAPRVDYLLYRDDDDNVFGGAAYQVFVGLRGRGERQDLALHLRVPFWQARGRGDPRPAAQNDVWILLEATGRFWF